ncbi:hypothetical protein [Chloroflexus sp.]|uniref:hypothetical protein n=1 Tax=Chloroflexus sp. TaxID=1904827 RepID=UPI002ACE52AB|nr:hypothetical protein [Chloroflexus sp.]
MRHQHPDDPMGTGLPLTPAYESWKAGLTAQITSRYPTVAADVIAAGPWLEVWEDRALRTLDALARWLIEARCAESGVPTPAPTRTEAPQ